MTTAGPSNRLVALVAIASAGATLAACTGGESTRETSLPSQVTILTPSTLTVTITPVPTPSPARLSPHERISFLSSRGDSSGIYSIALDGSAEVAIAANPTVGYSPALSPDGRRVATTLGRDPQAYATALYTVNADGTDRKKLTDFMAADQPAWSPDGTQIAFTAVPPDANYVEIYVVRTDGTGLTRLTTNSWNDQYPAWSPDGSQIAFASLQAGSVAIKVVNADGSGDRLVTPAPRYATVLSPAWAPDGSRIAFVEGIGTYDIVVVNLDGTGRTVLTDGSADDLDPEWSPDSEWIAFASNRDGDYEIFVMRRDGSAQRAVTTNTFDDQGPMWVAPPESSWLPSETTTSTSTSTFRPVTSASTPRLIGYDPDSCTYDRIPLHGSVYVTDDLLFADFWVYVVDTPGPALAVSLTDNSFFARSCGEWYLTDDFLFADFKVAVVDEPRAALWIYLPGGLPAVGRG